MSEENKPKTFQIGDAVTWTSQAGGKSKTKTGRVVFIVPANIGLRQIVSRESKEYSVDHLGLFSGRDHESYLIQVGKSKRLYWPLVKYLEKVQVIEAGKDVYSSGISPLEQYKRETEPHNCE